jgi:hypothetical protein
VRLSFYPPVRTGRVCSMPTSWWPPCTMPTNNRRLRRRRHRKIQCSSGLRRLGKALRNKMAPPRTPTIPSIPRTASIAIIAAPVSKWFHRIAITSTPPITTHRIATRHTTTNIIPQVKVAMAPPARSPASLPTSLSKSPAATTMEELGARYGREEAPQGQQSLPPPAART